MKKTLYTLRRCLSNRGWSVLNGEGLT